jgi:Fe-S oxidoreductase
MATNRKLANCCGAGGMLAIHRPDVSEKVAELRIAEAKETGASLLISGCPRCDETFQKAMTANGMDDLKSINLVELTAEAVGLN